MLGACRGLDASIFYPDDDDEAEIAKQVCQECSVQLACLEFALLTSTGWAPGGVSRPERPVPRLTARGHEAARTQPALNWAAPS